MGSLWSSIQTSRASGQVELGGDFSWWRHQMEIFSGLLAICVGKSPIPGEFPTQRPVTRSFNVFFDLRPNKRLSKQLWSWWFETPSCPLLRHCNVMPLLHLCAKRMVPLSDIKRNTLTFSSFINTKCRWNLLSWKTIFRLSWKVCYVVGDDLSANRARASTAKVLA